MKSIVKAKLVTISFFVLLFGSTEGRGVELSAPFPGGERWTAGEPGSYYNEGYHTKKYNSQYAVDFNRQYPNNDDSNAPVVAAADGVVTEISEIPEPADSGAVYPNMKVVITHNDGDVTKYLHLKEVDVSMNQNVVRGQTIGRIGYVGKYATDSHLHFVYYKSVNGTLQN